MTEDLTQLPATFSYREARDLGVSKRQLYLWRDEGMIELLGHGLYRRADSGLADTDLIEVAHRAPQSTLCLISALVRHGLSDAIPAAHDIAVPRGRHIPALSVPIAWHRFDPATFSIGRSTTPLDDQTSIGLYDAERTIVDVLRLTHDGTDTGYEALRRWLRSGGKPADLIDVATHFPRVMPRLRTALEVLL